MKPGEAMHSAVEEVDLDPCDLYLDLGALIVEGRIPGLSDRGFGEGPHCPTAGTAVLNLQPPQGRHRCNSEAPDCQRYEQIQKHMLLLWKNGIPMSIEVLLYPSCCIGTTPVQSVDTSSIPDMSYLMLEQWTVHMLPRRVPDASMNCRGLMQAIRSFLHFSQLCAWYSLTGGKSPQNVHYRVCVPGEAFSSRFSAPPDCHVFPIANIGRNHAMKVLVKTHPRCGEIPTVMCHKHAGPYTVSKSLNKQEAKSSSLEERNEDVLYGAEEGEFIDGILPTETRQTSRTSSPADTMLGESLLDPPNSLCMYPKRYQSPSRCGSPSLEVPEHLMFGKGAIAKREAQRHRLSSEVQDRSRPIQKPVIQRVLKRNLSDSLHNTALPSSSMPDVEKKGHSKLDDMLLGIDNGKSDINTDLRSYYLYPSEDFSSFSKGEMENVLRRLRNRCSGSRTMYDRSKDTYLIGDIDGKLSSKQPPSDKSAQDINSLCSEFEKLNLMSNNSSMHSKFACRTCESGHPLNHKYDSSQSDSLQKEYKGSKTKCKTSNNSNTHSKGVLNMKIKHYTNDDVGLDACNVLRDRNSVNSNQNLHRDQGNHYKPLNVFQQRLEQKQSNKWSFGGNMKSTYQFPAGIVKKSTTLPDMSGVNFKKCGALLESLNSESKFAGDEDESDLTSELQIPEASEHKAFIDECESGNIIIPSAADKAQFRRSLDSATSLVFHKKSGLPLTSSPAPIRKSGTCFDFDSSLTSVSAIKRALFEKEPNDGEIQLQRAIHVSMSAPASMTVSSLLGTFEESVLNGRLDPVSTVEGFTAEIGASGSFCPRHIILPVTIFFYTLQDIDKVTSPYLGHINLSQKDYHVPKSGTIQVTLFNPHRTVVKMFVVRYDLSDMPPNCQTFLRQRTLYMPTDASDNDPDAQKWLRYLIHLRFTSSKSGRIYLHTDIRMIIFRKSDLDAASVHGQWQYELRSFTQGPVNPKFSPRKA